MYKFKFVLGQATGFYSELFYDANKFIDEFGNEVKPEFMRFLLLLKANAASQQGKRELAYNLYQQVLQESKEDYGSSACAHRGLAITLGYNNIDGLNHEGMAADVLLKQKKLDDLRILNEKYFVE